MTGKKLLINFLLVALSLQCAPKIPVLECTDSCGRSLEKYLQTRIIAGHDIGYYKYPWFGIIKKSNSLKCGCAMINEQFAITVASCFKDYLPVTPNHDITGVYTVTLGAYNRCNTNETTQKTFSVQTIYIHAGFDVSKRANNIALVKLSDATTFEPICLPSKPISEGNRPSEGTITGAGMTNYNPQVKTCAIHEARVLIYSNDYCNKSLANIGEDTSLINNNFCAGGAQETRPYGCGADLGGPLIVQDNSSTSYLLGLISFKKCPDNDNITLYVDVSQYLPWIQTTLNLSKPNPTPTPTPTLPTTTEDYDYVEYHPTTSTTTSTTNLTTTSTTPSSLILGPSKRKEHSNRHGHKKHGSHLKREAKHDHQSKHHEKHEKKHHKKHHNEKEHEMYNMNH